LNPPPPYHQQIVDNVARVRERIAIAAIAAGRVPETVQLVAVTKYVGPQMAAALLAANCPVLGESRPQQLFDKSSDPDLVGARWHLIGHLQRNKVRRTLPLVALIHSIDSLRLLQAIDRVAGELSMKTKVLLEVNCSGDAEKGGLSQSQLLELIPRLMEFPHVEVRGLMTMAARAGGTNVAARNFSALRKLREQAITAGPPGLELPELSMGMSGDFEVAIREGATQVRIGSLLFEGVPRQ
jgi:pyridoxal phosphate enzyme (YggS family)